MNKLYDMLLGSADPDGMSLADAASLSADEIVAFDSMLTKTRGLPYYPLGQVLDNQKIIQYKYPDGNRPEIPVQRPESYTVELAEEPPAEQARRQNKRYSGEEAIGEGGTAVVYRAMDHRLKRPVALKRFKEEDEADEDSDYLAELESASRVRHPNVVSTFDADVDDKGRFIVMELIDGEDVQALIEREVMKVGPFFDFAVQSIEGLLATHEGGLLHLDLKPSNIMVSQQVSGRKIVKLVDFGRAQLIEGEEGKPPKGLGMDGSIYFAAPEQLLSQDLDRRTDLYALGCVFYWALAGERPFEGSDTLSVMASHLQNTVDPLVEKAPLVPAWLADWVMSLIQLEPDNRPHSAKDALHRLVEGGRACETIRYSH